MAVVVPLSAIPSQSLQSVLNGQTTQLNVYQLPSGIFMDVESPPGTLIIGGVLAHNGNLIVRNAYLGFSGDFAFTDTQGSDDPAYTGLGSRFQLACYTADELATNPVYATQ